ncbi:site-2 protease family protein [Patescibacteria group bacterium]|nr:site-2 protease family protein [Patescibacteria group bacterium]
MAIFNILPIPALDGGRILGVLIQRISRMKAEKYFLIESYINAFFFVLLLGIGILVIFQDLTNIRGL